MAAKSDRDVTPLVVPTVSSVTPNLGPPAGGTAVTIAGVGFTGATSVRFAGQPATNVVVASDTSITCKTPPALKDGPVSVAVTTPGGTGASGPTAYNYTGATGTSDVFPAFVPIVPPPPIGADKTIPTFPPPTPPPIGTVPVGDLVGPAIAPAAVPPSVAGVVQPQYKTGSATLPTAASLFPSFSAAGPHPAIIIPVSPPPLPDNRATKTGAVWDNKTPPSTPTTAPITLNGASNLTPVLADVGVLKQNDEERNHRIQPKLRADRRREQHF